MKISVVMTTYNGTTGLMGQLMSLRDQTRKPDEVLIFDDVSTDSTAETVRNFIHENNLYEWTFVQNDHNKGWRRNFADAINAARGDIIFLCDQDDEWNLDKIAVMAEVMESSENIKVLASNYNVRYEKNARRIKSWMLKPYGKERIERVKLTGITYEPIRPGCTYAFRKEMISVFNAVWAESDAHDRILWDCALAEGTLYILNEKLLTQIRYGGNQTPANQLAGPGRNMSVAYRRGLAERLLKVIQNESGRQWLMEYIKVAEDREKALNASSVTGLIRLAKSRDYLPLPVSWILDINAVLRNKIHSISHKQD